MQVRIILTHNTVVGVGVIRQGIVKLLEYFATS